MTQLKSSPINNHAAPKIGPDTFHLWRICPTRPVERQPYASTKERREGKKRMNSPQAQVSSLAVSAHPGHPFMDFTPYLIQCRSTALTNLLRVRVCSTPRRHFFQLRSRSSQSLICAMRGSLCQHGVLDPAKRESDEGESSPRKESHCRSSRIRISSPFSRANLPALAREAACSPTR
jgi:hypothetical protein